MKLLGSRSCNTVVVIVRHTTADAVANTIVAVPVGDSTGNVSADTGRHIKCIGVGIACWKGSAVCGSGSNSSSDRTVDSGISG